MKKRVSFSIIAVLCAALLLYGLNAFAASSGTATSTSVSGTLKALSQDGTTVTVSTDGGDQTIPLAKSIWVLRDNKKAQLSDLKTGDKVEVILNSKKQAAYVKASTAEAQAPAQQAPQSQDTTAPSAASQTPATSVPTAGAAPTTPSAQAPTAAAPAAPAASNSAKAASPKANGAYPGLEGLNLQVDGSHFKLEIKQNQGNDGTKYELSLKSDGGGNIHLKGEEAAAWIQALLSEIDLKSAGADQRLLQEIAGLYGIDASKLHVQLNAQWNQAAEKVKGQDDEGGDEQPASVVNPPAPKAQLQNKTYENDDNGYQTGEQHKGNGKLKGHGEKNGKKHEDD